MQPYLDMGCRVLLTSALTGKGVDRLRSVLHERTTVLAGMSGVGKSTLLNAVQPGLQLRTGEVSDHSHTGRHTTTQVNLIKLEMGGYVVDTPGIREFGLKGLRQYELVRYYPEIAAIEGRCRFGDCTHTHEPGCAVKAALRQGNVSRTRFKSYTSIYATLPKSRAEERTMNAGTQSAAALPLGFSWRGLVVPRLSRLADGLLTVREGGTSTTFGRQAPDGLSAEVEVRDPALRSGRDGLSASAEGTNLLI